MIWMFFGFIINLIKGDRSWVQHGFNRWGSWDDSYQKVCSEVEGCQEIKPMRQLISKNPHQRCDSWEICVD